LAFGIAETHGRIPLCNGIIYLALCNGCQASAPERQASLQNFTSARRSSRSGTAPNGAVAVAAGALLLNCGIFRSWLPSLPVRLSTAGCPAVAFRARRMEVAHMGHLIGPASRTRRTRHRVAIHHSSAANRAIISARKASAVVMAGTRGARPPPRVPAIDASTASRPCPP
jgi:hypothetical protein